LIVKIPDNNRKEREYIISVIIGEFMGLEYTIEYYYSNVDPSHWEMHLANGKKILIEDHFFNKHPEPLAYLRQVNIPNHVERFEKLQIFQILSFQKF
jgi:hypothetical protein